MAAEYQGNTLVGKRGEVQLGTDVPSRKRMVMKRVGDDDMISTQKGRRPTRRGGDEPVSTSHLHA